jgi:hypothetical protein
MWNEFGMFLAQRLGFESKSTEYRVLHPKPTILMIETGSHSTCMPIDTRLFHNPWCIVWCLDSAHHFLILDLLAHEERRPPVEGVCMARLFFNHTYTQECDAHSRRVYQNYSHFLPSRSWLTFFFDIPSA